MKVQITIDGIKFDMPAAFNIPHTFWVTNNEGTRKAVHQCGMCSLYALSHSHACGYICERYAEELIRRTPKAEEVDDVR